MTAKCVGCGLDWNVSIYQKIPRTGYICPHCESRIRAGEPLKNIQASPKGQPQGPAAKNERSKTMKKALKTAPRGTAFNYAGQRWVVLEHNATGTLCLTEKIVEDRAFDDGNCNDFSKSSSLRYLNGPFLDTLIDAAGCSSAFLTSELDLTTDDGLKDYGTCNVTIFLLTVDQYRRNRDVIPNADDWWWLSTAVSTASNGYEHSARYVSAGGALCWHLAYRGRYGLRPACYLDSDLPISFDEQDVTAEQAGDIVKELIESIGGSFATEEQLRAAASFMLGTLRATREQEAAHE